ncbi:arginine transporter permease ArtM [Salmonella enterica subsp. enterica]|uniref:Arginine transporter permease ArtM n=1 Tax=Salmonella enterica I TaxID=59201 RepID=A0A447PGV1_SALET|nr:arginine transporter permease ArtM [Salmonella enterica subsp. enterica]
MRWYWSSKVPRWPIPSPLMEVMGYSQLLYGRTYDVMVFGAAGVIYLVVNGLLTLMMRLIERKALAFERRN